MIVYDNNKSFYLEDIHTKKKLKIPDSITCIYDMISDINFTPDAKHLLITGIPCKIIEIDKMSSAYNFSINIRPSQSKITIDNTYLYIWQNCAEIQLYHIKSRQQIYTLQCPFTIINLNITLNPFIILLGLWDKIQKIDIRTGEILLNIKEEPPRYNITSISSDNRYIVYIKNFDYGAHMKLRFFHSGKIVVERKIIGIVKSICFSSDCRYMAIAGTYIHLFDLDCLPEKLIDMYFPYHHFENETDITHIDISDDNRFLFYKMDNQNMIKIINFSNGFLIKHIESERFFNISHDIDFKIRSILINLSTEIVYLVRVLYQFERSSYITSDNIIPICKFLLIDRIDKLQIEINPRFVFKICHFYKEYCGKREKRFFLNKENLLHNLRLI